MKILLINNNPVVSRLTALSARKENIDIDEIQEITELNSDGYDIVFVDSDSLTKDVNDIIKEHLNVKKSVLFYADGDEEDKSIFDITILKPFLPSEVSAVIHSVEEMEEKEEKKQDDIKDFNLLDKSKEEDKEEEDKEGLVELNDLVDIKDEQVVAETKDSFDKKLEEAFPLKINTLDDELFEDKESNKEESIKDKTSKEKELFELDIRDDELTLDEELFAKEVTKVDELLDFEDNIDDLKLDKIKEETTPILEDELLMVLDDNENNKDKAKDLTKVEESEAETKILDKNEIENIKGLLSEDIDNEMTLDDLMTPTKIVESSKETEDKQEKKSEKEDNKESQIEKDTLVKALSTLSVEALRGLFAGAEININIKFPEAK